VHVNVSRVLTLAVTGSFQHRVDNVLLGEGPLVDVGTVFPVQQPPYPTSYVLSAWHAQPNLASSVKASFEQKATPAVVGVSHLVGSASKGYSHVPEMGGERQGSTGESVVAAGDSRVTCFPPVLAEYHSAPLVDES
jgi:hypothetical protein